MLLVIIVLVFTFSSGDTADGRGEAPPEVEARVLREAELDSGPASVEFEDLPACLIEVIHSF